MVGGGGGKGIALYCSEDFSKAYSQQSDVYKNPPLCSKLYKKSKNDGIEDREFFSIANVELYEFFDMGSM